MACHTPPPFQNSSWKESNRLLMQKCINERIPLYATFELTPFCNYTCKMCYIRHDQGQLPADCKMLPTEKWIESAREAAKLGTLFLSLTGGEIFTHPDFCEIYEEIYNLGFLITLRTNGSLLKGKILDLLAKKKPYKIIITIYGSSNDTYERLCGVSNGFSIVAENIREAVQRGICIECTMTENKINTTDKKQIESFCKNFNLLFWSSKELVNPVRGVNRDISDLAIVPSDEECTISNDMRFMPYNTIKHINRSFAFYNCNGFGAKFAITWDGKMMNCLTVDSSCESIVHQSLSKAFSNLVNNLQVLKRPNECLICKYFDFCQACPSNFISATGYVDKCNEDICRMARYFYKKHLLISNNK